MTRSSSPPFSARNRREQRWIDDDFPASARTGMLHLLHDAIEKNYVNDWASIAKELGRIARESPKNYNIYSVESTKQARIDVDVSLDFLDWEKVFDFCERLYSHLAFGGHLNLNNEDVYIGKEESQSYLASEIQRLFDEESFGYEFRDGLVQRRGKQHTVTQVSRADKVLADNRLNLARRHFSKAVGHFRDRKKPDLENAVKEAVCAVEAAAKELFPDAKAATLGDFTKWACSNPPINLPKTIGQTISGLYAFRNSGEGVSHGATAGGIVTAELAEYVLGIAASQIIFLADTAVDLEEPPF